MEDKEIEEDHEYSELDKLVSDTAVTLVKEGKAKWQYLAEGYYNIASIFMITDQNYSEKYAEGIEIIGNKVFRVLKHGEIYSAFSSAKEQLEYNKLFSNYVVNESKEKDPDLYKYIAHAQDIKMTNELIKSISDGIEESRRLYIENYLKKGGK